MNTRQTVRNAEDASTSDPGVIHHPEGVQPPIEHPGTAESAGPGPAIPQNQGT